MGSFLCGISNSAIELILFRLIQGTGAAMMVVNSIALITEAFPQNERGRALGINAITFAAGGVIGPILGGFILTVSNWRWMFFIKPIGIAGAIWGYMALKELSVRKKGEKFNFIGAIIFSIALIALLLALTLGIQPSFISLPILGLFLIFLAMGVVFSSGKNGNKSGS